ncbi:MAG: Cu(I)-responsive transcriptional regulator [Proteobacteria bacterium]|uniref:Cu(I)-responsive transcriptional regulator n=1 Tax=Zoogloea sp. LCSB751 TaxID=1965277 RepID=UPI0009A4E454|nr:Cu(I)-responsive transcriptional regulator [Zoogloea sp. LCSB751]MBS0349319.1 Cu(I)-responsive transcriptional regulator [Pseudomonadota bacterium]
MNIGEAARLSGISAKMIRHYEGVQLLSPAQRTDSGYRQYTENDVRALQFIRRARDLGFSIDEIRDLLSLWQDRNRPSREVKALAAVHLETLDKRLKELHSMKSALEHLVHGCQGNDRPDCPILETLAGSGDEATSEANAASLKRHRRGHQITG